MTRIILAATLAALSLPAPTRAGTQVDSVRQRAEQACYDDANRLCADAIPQEDRVEACMRVHRSQLSPKCRALFDAATK